MADGSLYSNRETEKQVSQIAHKLDVQESLENFRYVLYAGWPVILLAGAAIACRYLTALAPNVASK